jgi:hypothetical protein
MYRVARPIAALVLALALHPARAAESGAANAPAGALPKPEAPEAWIPFADHGGIWNWEADGERGLWVQSSHRTWYYGAFSGPCVGLQFHEALKFRFSPSGTLDRFSEVETGDSGGRCWFKSFKASEAPPRSDKHMSKADKGSTVQGAKGAGSAPPPAAP